MADFVRKLFGKKEVAAVAAQAEAEELRSMLESIKFANEEFHRMNPDNRADGYDLRLKSHQQDIAIKYAGLKGLSYAQRDRIMQDLNDRIEQLPFRGGGGPSAAPQQRQQGTPPTTAVVSSSPVAQGTPPTTDVVSSSPVAVPVQQRQRGRQLQPLQPWSHPTSDRRLPSTFVPPDQQNQAGVARRLLDRIPREKLSPADDFSRQAFRDNILNPERTFAAQLASNNADDAAPAPYLRPGEDLDDDGVLDKDHVTKWVMTGGGFNLAVPEQLQQSRQETYWTDPNEPESIWVASANGFMEMNPAFLVTPSDKESEESLDERIENKYRLGSTRFQRRQNETAGLMDLVFRQAAIAIENNVIAPIKDLRFRGRPILEAQREAYLARRRLEQSNQAPDQQPVRAVDVSRLTTRVIFDPIGRPMVISAGGSAVFPALTPRQQQQLRDIEEHDKDENRVPDLADVAQVNRWLEGYKQDVNANRQRRYDGEVPLPASFPAYVEAIRSGQLSSTEAREARRVRFQAQRQQQVANSYTSFQGLLPLRESLPTTNPVQQQRGPIVPSPSQAEQYHPPNPIRLVGTYQPQTTTTGVRQQEETDRPITRQYQPPNPIRRQYEPPNPIRQLGTFQPQQYQPQQGRRHAWERPTDVGPTDPALNPTKYPLPTRIGIPTGQVLQGQAITESPVELTVPRDQQQRRAPVVNNISSFDRIIGGRQQQEPKILSFDQLLAGKRFAGTTLPIEEHPVYGQLIQVFKLMSDWRCGGFDATEIKGFDISKLQSATHIDGQGLRTVLASFVPSSTYVKDASNIAAVKDMLGSLAAAHDPHSVGFITSNVTGMLSNRDNVNNWMMASDIAAVAKNTTGFPAAKIPAGGVEQRQQQEQRRTGGAGGRTAAEVQYRY